MNLKALTADIKRQRDYLGISSEELAASGVMSVRNLQRRMRDPESITLGELQRFAKKLHIEINYTIR